MTAVEQRDRTATAEDCEAGLQAFVGRKLLPLRSGAGVAFRRMNRRVGAMSVTGPVHTHDAAQAGGCPGASSAGTVSSCVVDHHPRDPAFDYATVVAVVEFAEGTRPITDLVGIAPEDFGVDQAVVLESDAAPELSLPVFPPVVGKDF